MICNAALDEGLRVDVAHLIRFDVDDVEHPKSLNVLVVEMGQEKFVL